MKITKVETFLVKPRWLFLKLHTDEGIVGLGERVTGPGLAEDIVKAFRDAKFLGGRHQQRVDKMAQLDKERT